MRIHLRSIGRWLGDLIFQPPADLAAYIWFTYDERTHR